MVGVKTTSIVVYISLLIGLIAYKNKNPINTKSIEPSSKNDGFISILMVKLYTTGMVTPFTGVWIMAALLVELHQKHCKTKICSLFGRVANPVTLS